MNAEITIRKFIQDDVQHNNEVDIVRFVDRLLLIAPEFEEIQCALTANQGGLRFQVSGQPAWEVEIGRAKSKLRMMCARLAVLCQESGGKEFIIYGGDGIIEQACVDESSATLRAGSIAVNGPPGIAPARGASPERPGRWAVQTMNTMSKQFFKIHAL